MSKISRQLRRLMEAQQKAPGAPKPRELVSLIRSEIVAFRGPLPPPEVLQRYEEICPGSAQMIMRNFDEQGQHRRKIEERVITDKGAAAKRGQWMGFVVVLTAIAVGAVFIWNGKPTEGLATIITAVGGIASVFVVGRAFEYFERKRKETPPSN